MFSQIKPYAMKKLLLLSLCGILLIGCDNEIATPSNALEERQKTLAPML